MTTTAPIASTCNGKTLEPLAWAIFLGCSWTWCIGMFLPVLLVRDIGLWGWVVFALPNVIGAAAMGWVLPRGRSERIVAEHRAACAAFSIVTIAFHVFFTLWLVSRLLTLPIALTAFVAAMIYRTVARAKWDWVAAAVALVVSLVAFVLFLRVQGFPSFPSTARAVPLNALWLAPVSTFGFLLCPYLDLTFHRARQATTPEGARAAFTLGFGVVFFLMIIFSLCYARPLAPVLEPERAIKPLGRMGTIIGIHMLVQIALTIALHEASLAALKPARRQGLRHRAVSRVLSAALLGLAGFGLSWLPRYHGLDAGEIVYRCFMAFYGLLAPAYVWICMIPDRTGHAGVTPTKLRLLILATIAATPMFWFGFIENRMVWLVPGLLIVLLARYAPLPQRTTD